ncbi:phosphotransferase [Nocardia sp. R16R-3T]
MSVTAKFELGAKIARVAIQVTEDRFRNATPVDLRDVPHSVRHLSPEWLTAALCAEVPGARVLAYEIGSGSNGSTYRDRLTVTYNETGRDAGLPENVFAKSSPGFTSRLVCGLTGALESEAGFYRDLRPKVEMNTPQTYHVGLNMDRFHSMFLLEDVAAARGAEFGNPISMYVDRPMAESMVTNLAALHGTFWDDEILRTTPWIPSSLEFQERVEETISYKGRSLIGVERARSIVPDELYRRRAEIWPGLLHSLRANTSGIQTLLHCDVHIGNWYRDADGGMGLYDWQCMAHGGWALDVVYTLTSALTIDDRRAWEEDLVRLYLSELTRHGVQAPAFDDAWIDYRQQIFQALGKWLYTIGSGRLQPKMQRDDITAENVKRLAQATIDLRSLDV